MFRVLLDGTIETDSIEDALRLAAALRAQPASASAQPIPDAPKGREGQRCSRCQEAAEPGHKMCGKHMADARRYARQLRQKDAPPSAVIRRCPHCRQPGHQGRTCPQIRPVPPPKPSTVRCRNCGQVGHRRDTCEAPPRTDRACDKCAEAAVRAGLCEHHWQMSSDAHKRHHARIPKVAPPPCSRCGKAGHGRKHCPDKLTNEKRVVDITGQVFSELTVLHRVQEDGITLWLCRCSCGNEIKVAGNRLRAGGRKSCSHRPPSVERTTQQPTVPPPHPPEPTAIVPDATPKVIRKCGKCQQPGHRSETCGRAPAVRPAPKPAPVAAPSAIKGDTSETDWPPLTPEQQSLIENNSGLVHMMARRLPPKIDYEDLVQEGTIGLMRATRDWDPAKGKFSTYAMWWIRHFMFRAIQDHGGDVRIPVHAQQAMRAGDTLPATRLTRGAVPMDAPIGDDASTSLHNILAAPESDPGDALDAEKRRLLIEQVLSRLNPREAQIIRLRFGFGDEDERTLKEVGEVLDLGKERIRQLEQIALTKFKAALGRLGLAP